MLEAGRREAGFTLFEMMVVLAVLGLIGALVYPAMARLGAAGQAREAVERAVLTLEAARARSIRIATPQRVAARGLPVGSFVMPAAGIVFYPDGTASGGVIEVGGARFAVAQATGGLVRTVP